MNFRDLILLTYDDIFKYSTFSEPFFKSYGFDKNELANIGSNQILLIAELAGLKDGYALASKAWNNCV